MRAPVVRLDEPAVIFSSSPTKPIRTPHTPSSGRHEDGIPARIHRGERAAPVPRLTAVSQGHKARRPYHRPIDKKTAAPFCNPLCNAPAARLSCCAGARSPSRSFPRRRKPDPAPSGLFRPGFRVPARPQNACATFLGRLCTPAPKRHDSSQLSRHFNRWPKLRGRQALGWRVWRCDSRARRESFRRSRA